MDASGSIHWWYRACNFTFVIFEVFTKGISKCNKYFKISEPFKNLFTQGMVCHETYKDNKGNWLYPDEIQKVDINSALKKLDKSKVIIGPPESMSKSKIQLIQKQ